MEIRITGQQVKNITAAYQKIVKPKSADTPGAPAPGDRVELSPEAERLLKLTKTAQAKGGELAEVREELVASLKERIASGHYQVDPHAVAERMWQELKGR